RLARIRLRFADLIHARLRWSALQPIPQFLDRGRPALRENLDRTVRHIAGDAPQGQPSGFESGAVPKEDALNLPKDEETADDFVQGNWNSVGQSHGRLKDAAHSQWRARLRRGAWLPWRPTGLA